jgi:hypothetical protein
MAVNLATTEGLATEARDYFPLCFVQPYSVAHTSSYPILTGLPFPGRKSLWCGAEYSPFYPLPRPRMNGALYSLLHKSSWIFAILRIFCLEENIKIQIKYFFQKYSFNSF